MTLSVKDWRAQQRKIRDEGMPFELPSGLVVQVRNVPIADFLTRGGIPDSLAPLVAEMINGKANLDKLDANKAMLAQMEMTDAVCRVAIVTPRIVDDPKKDDEISLKELDEEDKGALMGLLGLPARKLEPFCHQQTRTLERLRQREALEAASESDAEPAPVVPDGDRDTGDG
jgi:hypothetical protein